jgi:hypothetical protein
MEGAAFFRRSEANIHLNAKSICEIEEWLKMGTANQLLRFSSRLRQMPRSQIRQTPMLCSLGKGG